MVKLYHTYRLQEPQLLLANSSVFFPHQQSLLTAASQYLLFTLPNANYPHLLLKRAESQANVTCAIPQKTNSKQLLAGYQDGDIVVWNVPDRVQERCLNRHTAAVVSLDLDSKGSRLLSGSLDNTIIIWDIFSQDVIARVQAHKAPVLKALFMRPEEDADQVIISSGREGFVKVWNESLTGLDIENSECSEGAMFAIDHSQHLIFIANAKNDLKVYRLTESYKLQVVQAVKRESYSKVNQMTIHKGLLYLLTADRAIQTYKILEANQQRKKAKRLAKRARQKQQASSDQVATVYVSYKQTTHFKSQPKAIGFNPSLKVVLKNQITDLQGNSIKMPANSFLQLQLQTNYLLARTSAQLFVYILAQKLVLQLQHSFVDSATFIPNTSFLVLVVSEAGSKAMRVVSVRTRETIDQIQWTLKKGGLSVGEDEKGVKIIGWGSKVIKIWKLVKIEEQIRIQEDREIQMGEDILRVELTPDGKYLAVILADSTMRILYQDSHKLFLSLYGHKLPITDFSIASDSSMLATGSVDKDIKIWALDFGNCMKSIFAHTQPLTAVRFIKNTHYLLSAAKDSKVKFWDIDTAQLIFQFEDFKGPVLSLAVSDCGSYFFVGGSDLGVRLFRQTNEQSYFKEQQQRREQKRIMAQAQQKDKEKFKFLKFGQEFLEFLERHAPPGTPDIKGLLELVEKTPPSSLPFAFSFLHTKHRQLLLVYVRAMIKMGLLPQLIWRVLDALGQRQVQQISYLRKEWLEGQRRVGMNLGGLRMMRKRLREQAQFKV